MDYTKDSASSLLGSEAFQNFRPSSDLIWKSHVLYAGLAAGCTLPWYTLIAGADYFQYRYPDTYIVRVLSTAYLASWLVSYLLFSKFGRHCTSWTKITVGLSLGAASLLAIPIMDAGFITGQHGTAATYYVTMAVAIIAGTADATAQGSLLGIGAELPDRMLQSIILGTGAGGVLVFIVRVVTKIIVLATLDSVRYSAVFYFTVAAFLMVIFLGAFVYVHRLPEMGYYTSLGMGNFDSMRLLLEDEASITPEIASSIAIATVAAGTSASTQTLFFKPVVKKLYFLTTAFFLVSFVTLSIFPGLLAGDMYSPNIHQGWYPLLFVGTYVVLDFLGRLLTACTIPDDHSFHLGAAITRLLVLVGLFLLSLLGPKLFRSEIALVFLTGLLAFSNGFLMACLTILIPKSVASNEMEAAGVLMGTITATGCVLGSAASWLWVLIE